MTKNIIDQFISIENAAHTGAFGDNPRATPTDAQAIAGNYKLGRVSIYDLPIAIEQPRNSYRTGIDQKTGKRWTNRMAAHYGYFSGTKGADGDGVDCFIGFYPQSEHIYIINQFVGGRFDEHKVMLCFPDENTATRAYLDSYDKGWTGLQSIIKASITQFKWWLKNGNMNNAIALNHLPYEGFSTMNKQVRWGADSQPEGMTIAKLLYEIRRADGGENLLLDSVTMPDILEDVDSLLAFDALVTPYAKLEQKMQILQRAMERKGGTVKVESLQISDPFKQSGVAQVAALFELSDGQTVSIFFHNPDIDPRKIQQGDELISWKWLLNKKDITIVVAPEQGKDLNPRVVAERIMNLAEKNSPAFVRANGKRAEKMQAIEDIKTEITGLEKELKDAQYELEVAKVEAEDRLLNPVAMAGELNPVSPEGYAKIMTDPALQEQYQGVLDAFFQERIIAVRNALHELGWVGGKLGHELFGLDNQLNLAKNGSLVHFEFINAGAGKNIIGVKYNEISDDLIKTPEQLAAVIDATTIADELNPTSPEGYAKIKGIGNMELRYQDVLDDFFQDRIIAVRNALMDVGWSGVRQKGNYDLSKNGYVAKFNFKRVGAGANVVGYYVSVMDGKDIQAEIGDMLTGTPADVAASIDAVITNAGRVTQANYPSQELDLTPAPEITPESEPAIPTEEPDEQISQQAEVTPEAEAGESEALESKAIEMVNLDGVEYKPMDVDEEGARANWDLAIDASDNDEFEAAKQTYRAMQGHYVNTSIGKVFITGAGWREIKQGLDNDSLRSKTVPFIPVILKTGKAGTIEPLHKNRKDDITGFYPFTKVIKIEDKQVTVVLKVAQKPKGELVYHLRPFDKGVLDSVEGAGLLRVVPDSPTPQEPAEPTLDSSVDQDGGSINIIILKVFDKDGNELVGLEDDVEGDVDAEQSPIDAQEQTLIAGLIGAYSEAANKIMTAISTISWAGIVSIDAANYEYRKLVGMNFNEPIKAAREKLQDAEIDFMGKATDTPEFDRFSQAQSELQAAGDDILRIGREKQIETGKVKLANLSPDATLEEKAGAVFEAKGLTGDHSKLILAIKNKEVEYLRDLLGNIDNKASRTVFEMATGIKLEKTVKGTLPQIDEWAGIAPEQRAAIEAAKQAEHNTNNLLSDLKYAWNPLEYVKVGDGGGQTMQEWLLSAYGAGYTHIEARKKGVATTYWMVNKEHKAQGFLKSKVFNAFLKAALAFDEGDNLLAMKKALKALGIDVAEQALTPVERVNAAYSFNADDDFKEWLAESVDKTEQSPFLTAKAMDEAAKRNGADIEWGFFGGMSKEDESHLFGKALDSVEGDSEADIAIIDEDELGATFTPDSGDDAVFDSVVLDGVDQDGYVGKILKGGVVVGRIDMGDDGKALVFVGESGDTRVKFASGAEPRHSDDDAAEMVDSLFNVSQSDVSNEDPAETAIDPAPKAEEEALPEATPAVEEPVPVATGNPELDKQRDKLKSLADLQERMKSANKVVNNKKLSDDQKVEQLIAQGFDEHQVREILKPDYMGRIGFAGYQLTNNNAVIKNTQKRIAQLEAQALAESQAASGDRETSYDFDGGTIDLDYGDDRLRVNFDSKPGADMISKLKQSGFKWSPTNSAWQRQLTDNAISTANYLFGTKIQTAASAMNEEVNKPRGDVIVPVATEPVAETDPLVQQMIDAVANRNCEVVEKLPYGAITFTLQNGLYLGKGPALLSSEDNKFRVSWESGYTVQLTNYYSNPVDAIDEYVRIFELSKKMSDGSPSADPQENPIKARFEAELEALKAETDIERFDSRLDEIAGRIELAGMMDDMDAELNAAADKLTALMTYAEKKYSQSQEELHYETDDTQGKIDEFNRIRAESGIDQANKFAKDYISIPGRTIPERTALWGRFNEKLNSEIEADKKAKLASDKAEKKAKKDAKADIKGYAQSIISLSSGANYEKVSEKERKFLNDIQTKRKFTQKQIDWLSKIMQRFGMKIEGDIDYRLSLNDKIYDKNQYAYTENDAYDRFDLPTYDPDNKRWYDAED